jgi:hypothetical protein
MPNSFHFLLYGGILSSVTFSLGIGIGTRNDFLFQVVTDDVHEKVGPAVKFKVIRPKNLLMGLAFFYFMIAITSKKKIRPGDHNKESWTISLMKDMKDIARQLQIYSCFLHGRA